MSGRLHLGLRGRFTAALVLTSALTLVVAAAALLAPLEQRLRADAVRTLAETALAARPRLERLPAGDVRPHSRALRAAVEAIRRRTGAEVAVVDARGGVVAASEPRDGEQYSDAVEALADDRVISEIARSPEGVQARVAVPVRRGRDAYALSLQRPLATLQSAERVVGRSFLLAALAAMAAALAVGSSVPRRLVRRMEALRDVVMRADEGQRIAGEHLDDAGDEVGDLARAFAAMQRRVAEQEQARRTFVATASHELRTPLTSLHLMLGLLRDDLQGEAPDLNDAREQVERATAQSARITRLARDLLDLSRLDAVVALRDELVDLHALAGAVIAEFEPVGGASMKLEAPRAAWVRGDPDSLAQILRILLDNALRFAPSGTVVTVSVRERGNHRDLAVCDGGPGIPDEDRERIFERFQRGSQVPTGAGFGLGLAIGRELAHRMSGQLRLSSTVSPTCFTLELPAAHTAPASSRYAPAWPRIRAVRRRGGGSPRRAR